MYLYLLYFSFDFWQIFKNFKKKKKSLSYHDYGAWIDALCSLMAELYCL